MSPPPPQQGTIRKREQECCHGRCICCPYGCYYTAPMITTVIAALVTLGVPWSCNFFSVEYRTDGMFFSDEPSEFRVGPWTVEDFNLTSGTIGGKGDCVFWSDHETLGSDDMDGALRFARVVLFFTSIPAYILTVVFCFGSCCVFEPKCLKCISFSFIAIGAFLPLSLVSLASTWCQDADHCKIRGGGIGILILVVLWILAGATILTMKEKDTTVAAFSRAPDRDDVEMISSTEQVVEHTLVEHDGTVVKVTTKTMTHADGSRSVVETREVLQEGGVLRPPTAAAAGATADTEFAVANAKPVIC